MAPTGYGQCRDSTTFTPPQRTSADMEVRAMQKKGQIKNQSGTGTISRRNILCLPSRPAISFIQEVLYGRLPRDSESWLFTLGGRQ